MKYLRIILLLLTILAMQSCIVKRGSNMDFIKKSDLLNDAEIVSISVPRVLMKSFVVSKTKDLKNEDPELAMAIKKIKKIKYMAISLKGQSSLSDNFNTYLANNNFEELMSLYSEGSKISINTKMKGNKIKTVMLGIIGENNYIFVDIKSNLDINELNRLIEGYEDQNQESVSESIY